jgi:hypothetical protein
VGAALRIDTTLPATCFAEFATRRIAAHVGVANEADRVLLERLFRELLSGVDPETGVGIAFDFRDQSASVLVAGKRAPGADSPILARAREARRSSFGPLVLDRREAPRGVLGWLAWFTEPAPQVDTLPDAAVALVGPATREADGVPVAYLERESWFAFAIGRRADYLVRLTQHRLLEGGRHEESTLALRHMSDTGDCVLGAVFDGRGLDGLSPADRAALTALFGAGENAVRPDYAVVAAFREGDRIAVESRIRYAVD